MYRRNTLCCLCFEYTTMLIHSLQDKLFKIRKTADRLYPFSRLCVTEILSPVATGRYYHSGIFRHLIAMSDRVS